MRILLAVVLVAGSALGCGTILNLSSKDPQVPFGGVRRDLNTLNTPRSTTGEVGIEPRIVFLFTTADVLLSSVGDMVTLPVALCLIKGDPTTEVQINPAVDDNPEKALAAQALELRQASGKR